MSDTRRRRITSVDADGRLQLSAAALDELERYAAGRPPRAPLTAPALAVQA